MSVAPTEVDATLVSPADATVRDCLHLV